MSLHSRLLPSLQCTRTASPQQPTSAQREQGRSWIRSNPEPSLPSPPQPSQRHPRLSQAPQRHPQLPSPPCLRPTSNSCLPLPPPCHHAALGLPSWLCNDHQTGQAPSILHQTQQRDSLHLSHTPFPLPTQSKVRPDGPRAVCFLLTSLPVPATLGLLAGSSL